MRPTYWMLSCASYEDPSEILNLIDEIKQTLDELSDDDVAEAERQCLLSEIEIHTLYTPFEFLKLSVDSLCA
jgi:hypothetical protein